MDSGAEVLPNSGQTIVERSMTLSTTREKATREVAVAVLEEAEGLCATCNHAASCAIRKASRKPVWFCEEFDNYLAPSGHAAEAAGSTRMKREPKPNGGAAGLCANCDSRENCSYRTPGAEIWFCEQYR